jgi:hypothetical protein
MVTHIIFVCYDNSALSSTFTWDLATNAHLFPIISLPFLHNHLFLSLAQLKQLISSFFSSCYITTSIFICTTMPPMPSASSILDAVCMLFWTLKDTNVEACLSIRSRLSLRGHVLISEWLTRHLKVHGLTVPPLGRLTEHVKQLVHAPSM